MSLELIRGVISSFEDVADWNVFAINHKTTKRGGDAYTCHTVKFSNREDLITYVKEIKEIYLNTRLAKYENVTEYDGSATATNVYKLKTDSTLLEIPYQLLLESLARPDEDTPIEEFQANCYALTGTIDGDEGQTRCVKFITMKQPMVYLKNKFFHQEGLFVPAGARALCLCAYFDLLFVDDDIYFFNMNGKTLFSMERAYQGICAAKTN